jgi:hypothetical protein
LLAAHLHRPLAQAQKACARLPVLNNAHIIGPVNDPTACLAERLRAICLALPEVTERPSHGAPAWFVRGKTSFVTLWADG